MCWRHRLQYGPTGCQSSPTTCRALYGDLVQPDKPRGLDWTKAAYTGNSVGTIVQQLTSSCAAFTARMIFIMLPRSLSRRVISA